MTWEARMVQSLAAHKAAGIDFEQAWRFALAENPAPRAASQSRREGSLVAFFQQACDDAWHDRQPVLAQLTDIDVGLGDQSSPAQVSLRGRHGRRAAVTR